MAPEIRLSRVVLQTPSTSFDDMCSWWSLFFDEEPRIRAGNLALFSVDGHSSEHHRLAIVASADVRSRLSMDSGIDHFSFTVRSVKYLVQSYERLKAKGVRPWPVHHFMALSMYFSDPDGNKVELQVDIPSTLQKNREFTKSYFRESGTWPAIQVPDDKLSAATATPQHDLQTTTR
jgi:catechol 2,3-dioxygenase-like lactoylglutathione lyase family enzyme